MIIEGPNPSSDYSYFLVDKCEDLKSLEKGLALARFEAEMAERDPPMEYRLLTRMNCHLLHYKNLYKSQNVDFKNKNRYNEVLPFHHNLVKLTEKPEKDADRYWHYVNASFVNSALNNEKGHKTFIAGSAPTTNTVESFW